MNNLLQKCVEELKAEKPDLSYIRGILETLIEIDGNETSSKENYVKNILPYASTEKQVEYFHKQDEASLLDAQARAMIANIQPQPQEI